ncbi:MarR family winged helix-turn-helix transcriptional regulator [Pseudarthrobacter oxydans]|uniref:MarR family winged helix-turn-helix transcriptional regulator n=1 Tax=Pseudarthrobacter oxydans TaxID=1671 RepID=UPI00380743F5
MIAESGECRARDLCMDLGIDAPVLSRHIADLEERHLAVRRPDPEDGRSQLITLTPAGFAELQEAGDSRSALLRCALANRPETDTRNTSEVIGRLSRTLNTYLREHPDPSPPPRAPSAGTPETG